MEKNEKTTRLPFFGIGRLLPFLGHVKKILTVMVILALSSSIMDVIMPLGMAKNVASKSASNDAYQHANA